MLLNCRDITMRFGGLTAVNKVGFGIESNDIMGLIGPNGSGKTTLFNIITGLYKPTAGEILFSEQNIAGRKPDYITRCGIARTFQNIRLFNNMTVWENVQVGRHCRFGESIFDDMFNSRRKLQEERRSNAYLQELLAMFNLYHLKGELARNLPYGVQRKLEIVRALASEPKLLLLDEPAAGMNAQETGELMNFISQVGQMGIALLVVEHDMKLVMNVCNKIAVLNHGKLIAYGAPREIQSNEEVISAYLGRQVKQGA